MKDEEILGITIISIVIAGIVFMTGYHFILNY